ncbi:hypothetical protein GGR52DRAFT_249161 [Hypoxylon sp. FL1284]|nr:hypothetical protein GGR52DRAFT_249161 [Hypoxylon sp. FL1284]
MRVTGTCRIVAASGQLYLWSSSAAHASRPMRAGRRTVEGGISWRGMNPMDAFCNLLNRAAWTMPPIRDLSWVSNTKRCNQLPAFSGLPSQACGCSIDLSFRYLILPSISSWHRRVISCSLVWGQAPSPSRHDAVPAGPSIYGNSSWDMGFWWTMQ